MVGLGGGLYILQRPGFEYNPNFAFEFRDYTVDDVSDDDVTPMASIQYLITGNDYIDTGSVYLTYSEGFLSGGLSEGPTDDFDVFLPEEVENWELGFRLDLVGNPEPDADFQPDPE